jgi:hypothetical protein
MPLFSRNTTMKTSAQASLAIRCRRSMTANVAGDGNARAFNVRIAE